MIETFDAQKFIENTRSIKAYRLNSSEIQLRPTKTYNLLTKKILEPEKVYKEHLLTKPDVVLRRLCYELHILKTTENGDSAVIDSISKQIEDIKKYMASFCSKNTYESELETETKYNDSEPNNLSDDNNCYDYNDNYEDYEDDYNMNYNANYGMNYEDEEDDYEDYNYCTSDEDEW